MKPTPFRVRWLSTIGQPTDAQRVGFLRKIVRAGIETPITGSIANHITAEYGVPARDFEGEVAAVFDWVSKHFRYTRENPNKDEYKSARWLFTHIQNDGQVNGDCDDYVVGLCSLLGAMGYHCRARIISSAPDAAKENIYDHIYAVVGLPPGEPPRQWVPLDATVPNATPGWEGRSYLPPKDFDL